ncbi:universal stress protein [Pontibacter sp. 172403-2]|uniref:universal stress protein n=1 Tax=Pontibacter rufus TaxID=2791028 RepID=UPI0018AF664A|nr:universal stress protein [Pontibacter sp. 172403-2]MBF9252251.1 universal stress protein [Pontibacter sp. 172403-2]
MKLNRILILIDDSPCAIRAAKYGYELARELQAKVALLSVVDAALAEGNVDAGIFPEQEAGKLKRAAEELLHNIRNDYGQSVETEIFVPEGNVKETILQMAKEWKAKLIVIGSHGRTGFSRLLMGSIAEEVIRHSPVPVFVVPVTIKL